MTQSQPHQILFGKLREIKTLGLIAVGDKGSGRFGLAFEKVLGIPRNSSREPDFMGIEIKTKSDKSLQTLFSRTPSRYSQKGNEHSFFEENCYIDTKRNRRALYTSFNNTPDSLGFCLKINDEVIQVIKANKVVLEYEAKRLEEALMSKHAQTVFLSLLPITNNGREECELHSAVYCANPSIDRFKQLLEQGKIYLDFTLSEKSEGSVKNHGYLWRIRGASIEHLYLHTEKLDLSEKNA
jgi:hypothetical protein